MAAIRRYIRNIPVLQSCRVTEFNRGKRRRLCFLDCNRDDFYPDTDRLHTIWILRLQGGIQARNPLIFETFIQIPIYNERTKNFFF